ncbi:hypothetical protein [Bradyrhizobium sp. Ce-3]|uniref:hypothetical protein n=1 Tax=Bradyrhizobium sp. Ce-3 TaxID=2913970 RepID=UPI001FB8BC89|nr:hypothetical protein [Bradyrhizobium sp. Ce-3]GKQ51126.1 hypothetical protein BRSPCE3_19810 [Bradyrhizobium sp. Ce-3]
MSALHIRPGAEMKLSFVTEDSAEAGFLAQELEEVLRSQGMPASALALKSASSEHMDIGSTLLVSLEIANQILGSATSLATLATGLFQILAKYRKDAVVDDEGERTRIRADASESGVKAALAKPRSKKKGSTAKAKAKARTKAETKHGS